MDNFYKNKKVAILGLGISGLSTYNFFISKNYSVVAFDDNEEINNKYLQQGLNIVNYNSWNLNELDCIIVSPGIHLYYPQQHPLISKIKQNNSNIPIICDIDVLIQFNSNIKFIAITGTNGKSTTVSLLQHIFASNNIKSILLGNIGVAALSTDVTGYEYIILELSSYQLSIMHNYSFFVAGILNIKPDHLDYHGNFNNYANAKLKIFNNQPNNGLALLDQSLKDYTNFITCKNITIVNTSNNDIQVSSKFLSGEHNLQNIMFCYYIASFCNISNNNIIKAIENFKGLPHRQQIVAQHNNILFVNDSKATNLESTEVALKTFTNCALILGGVEKVNNLDIILPYLKSSVKYIVLIGKSTNLFASILQNNNINYVIANNLPNAVIMCYQYCLSNKLTTVLLSPACASFDMFKSYVHRGQVFTDSVLNLISSLNKC